MRFSLKGIIGIDHPCIFSRAYQNWTHYAYRYPDDTILLGHIHNAAHTKMETRMSRKALERIIQLGHGTKYPVFKWSELKAIGLQADPPIDTVKGQLAVMDCPMFVEARYDDDTGLFSVDLRESNHSSKVMSIHDYDISEAWLRASKHLFPIGEKGWNRPDYAIK